MKPKTLKLLGLAGVVAVIGLAARFLTPRELPAIEIAKWPVMGTIAKITARQAGEPADAAAAIVRKTYAELNSLLSAWDAHSELNRLARPDTLDWTNAVSETVRPCYRLALEMRERSGGAFNPMLGERLKELGIVAEKNYAPFDLGAVAKGFALDRAAALVPENAKPLLLDLGGNLLAVGESKWRMGIRNPFAPKDSAAPPVAALDLMPGESAATSGNYERFAIKDGKRVSHILDGRTGEPTSGIAAVTVITPPELGAAVADALSTTLFVLGPHSGTKFLKQHYPAAGAIWISDNPRNPQIFTTSNLRPRVRMFGMNPQFCKQ